MKRTIIGIDFGSTQSSVSYMTFGAEKGIDPEFIKYKNKFESIPTIILLDSGNQDEVLAWGHEINNHIKDDKSGRYLLKSDFKRELGQNESADKCCRMFMIKLAEMIKRHFGSPNSALDFEDYEVIFSVPVSWTDEQKNLLKKYAVEAGLPCKTGKPVSSINTLVEPFAAIHAAMDENSTFKFKDVPENIMVIDFGGGTLDVCIVQTESLGKNPKIITSYGDDHLGGRDFDLVIRKIFADKHPDLAEINVTDEYDKIDVESSIREIKENISLAFKNPKNDKQEFSIYTLGKNYQMTISRNALDNKLSEIKQRIRKCIDGALRDAADNYGMKKQDISRVVLSGGSSQWYIVKEIIKECLDCDNDEMFFSTEKPELDVAKGLAVYAGRNVSGIKREGESIKCFIDKFLIKSRPTFEAGRDLPQSEEAKIIIGQIGTKYFEPYYITILRKTSKGTERAVVRFFARSNRPGLGILRGIQNVLSGKNTKVLPDEYQVYLCYKENGNAQEYYLEIRDAEYIAKKKALANNDRDAESLPDGKLVRRKLEFGKMAYQQNFGSGSWLTVDL